MSTETIIGDGGSGIIGDGGDRIRNMSRATCSAFGVLVTCAALALAGCTAPAVRLAVPPGWQDHAAQVAIPDVPPPTTPCPYDLTALCNTDKETGQVLAAYDAALAEANRRLGWLFSFFSAVPKEKK